MVGSLTDIEISLKPIPKKYHPWSLGFLNPALPPLGFLDVDDTGGGGQCDPHSVTAG